MMMGSLVIDPNNIIKINSGNGFTHGGRMPSVIIASYAINTIVTLPDKGLRNGQVLIWINNSAYDSYLRQADGVTRIADLKDAGKSMILMFLDGLWYPLAGY